MKILLIYPGRSGPLKVAAGLSTYLAKQGNDVYLYLLDSPEYKLDFNNFIVDKPSPHINGLNFFGRFLRILHLGRVSFQPDIVLTSLAFSIPFVKWFFRNIPIAYNMMGVPRPDVVINNLLLKFCYMLERLFSRRYVNKIPTYTTSDYYRQYMLKHWNKKVDYVSNGVNTEFYRPTKNKNNLRKDLGMYDYDLIVSLGLTRFTPVYNPLLYMRWYNHVLHQHKNKKILTIILGKTNTHQKEAIQQVFSNSSKEDCFNHHKFVLIYEKNAEMLRKYYQVSDVFISFFPQSLMEKEALACGIPVITAFWEGKTAKKLLRKLQHGLKEEQFIEKMNLLLSDEKFRNRYSSISRFVAENDFSNTKMGKKYLQILTNTAEQKAGHSQRIL